MIKTAIIGYGLSAKIFHLPFINCSDKFSFAAVSTSKKEEAGKDFPGVKVYADAEDLIRNSGADLVIITAPNAVHFSLAKMCLEQGKHLVLEKPMVNRFVRAEELCVLAREKNRMLSVFHNRRWDGDFLTLKKLIKENTLGEIRYFESHFDRFRPNPGEKWREQPGPGSGIWYDLGAHLLDQALHLFGTPEALTARCLESRPAAKTVDYFHVMLHYPQTEVVLHSSSFSAGPNFRFRLEGPKGSFWKFGLDPQEPQLKDGMRPGDAGFGREKPELFGTFYDGSESRQIETDTGCYRAYYQGVAEAISEGKPAPVSGEEGALVIKLLELAELSGTMGKTVSLK